MPLTGRQIKELQAALLDAFDYSSLKQMVLTELGTDLEEVALGGSLTEVTLKLITWAEQNGRTQALVAGAVNANQGNTRLQQFAAQHAATLAAVTSPTSVTTPAFGTDAVLPSTTAVYRQGADNPAENAAAAAAPARQPRPILSWVAVAAVTAGALMLLVFLWPAVAGLLRGAGDVSQTPMPALTAPVPGQATVSSDAPPTFTSDFVYEPDMIEQIELDTELGMLPTETITDFLQLSRVALGDLDAGGRAYDVRLRLKNTSARPIQLDLTQRFFSFEDDQGRKAELVYFCCDAAEELLSPGQSRPFHVLFRSVPGWEGKELSAEFIFFRVRGVEPVVSAAWQIRPLATAD